MKDNQEHKVTMEQLLKVMFDKGASDMHITTGTPPVIRVDGDIFPFNTPPLKAEDTKRLCYSVMNDEQKSTFEEHSEVDFSFGVDGLARFRANVFTQQGVVAGAFRTIPFRIQSFEELGLLPVIEDLLQRPSGLIVVTGPTGSGKTTTLAAMIDRLNSTRRLHIMTIEDPIEYIHPHKLSIVNQRELGGDTKSFKSALKHVLRQDPDIVLIGEMRDLETMEAALTISETGHLVFATLHTNSAVSSITRIIDAFPAHQQSQVRTKLSLTLQAVITQQLIARKSGSGRVMAMEVLVPNMAIRNLIREDKIHQIYGQMQVGQEQHGMQTLNQSLAQLVKKGDISPEEAMLRSLEPDELRTMLNLPPPSRK